MNPQWRLEQPHCVRATIRIHGVRAPSQERCDHLKFVAFAMDRGIREVERIRTSPGPAAAWTPHHRAIE